LLSSHILAEVEALCDRVSLVRQGRTVESGTLAELRHLTRTTISAQLGRVDADLAVLPGVHDVVVDDGTMTLDVDAEHLAGVLRRLGELEVRSLSSHPPTLEQLFLRHYGHEIENDGVPAAGNPR
jgi:ABC-2 type transport system ATP-binding protein